MWKLAIYINGVRLIKHIIELPWYAIVSETEHLDLENKQTTDLAVGTCKTHYAFLAQQGELIGWPWSGVHPSSTISKIFSETDWPI